MTTSGEELIAAAPRWNRPAMRAMFALAVRPRGLALLRRLAPADQAAGSLLALLRYDDPTLAAGLGWDAEAVVARGRALRRQEGRP
jgi:hypothetical protein